uniref:Diacylglycerol kinase n=1 Tax=Setaria digitata TaxID=48799 RepID=A0A915PYN7_9BILA
MHRRALAKSTVAKRLVAANSSRSHGISAVLCKHRTKNYWFDPKIHADEHIWVTSAAPSTVASSSRDTECYVGERDCLKVGEKRSCAACHIVVHTACLPTLRQLYVKCKITFQDESLAKKQLTSSSTVMDDSELKAVQEVIAITCSWCKRSYHNKVECFSTQCFERSCDRGDLKECRLFKIRPVPLDDGTWLPSQPLLVFVNPKSGGNKGSKILHTFCWLLNPRQVFDITALKGPEFGLSIYKKVASTLRVLVCGGDGTVGWILNELECLGWGGSFNEEPLAQLLNAIVNETAVTYLDRWNIKVEANLEASNVQTDEIDKAAQNSLPLTVMNNYYSIGADAHVALQFHHSRSANPQMLNSRLKNRIAYGGLGTIDLFKRTWKLLHEYITLECDGIDLTAKIKEFKYHCILFLNITYYAGGTIPWSNDDEESCRPSSCDGKVEVLGFTTATLAALQMGGKGERIAQCSHARITTSKAIPMQVDGEPCLLAPSTIEITFHSQVPMLRREKKSNYMPGILKKQRKISKYQNCNNSNQTSSAAVSYSLPVLLITSNEYNASRDNLERLKVAAVEIGKIHVDAEAELENVRQKIEKLIGDYSPSNIGTNSEWRFLDYVSSAEEGVFRVHRYQEQFMTLSDICCLEECIIILNNVLVRSVRQPSDEASTQTNHSFKSLLSGHSSTKMTVVEDCRYRGREQLKNQGSSAQRYSEQYVKKELETDNRDKRTNWRQFFIISSVLISAYLINGEHAQTVCNICTTVPAAIFTYRQLSDRATRVFAYKATLFYWSIHGILIAFDGVFVDAFGYFFGKFILLVVLFFNVVYQHDVAKNLIEQRQHHSTMASSMLSSIEKQSHFSNFLSVLQSPLRIHPLLNRDNLQTAFSMIHSPEITAYLDTSYTHDGSLKTVASTEEQYKFGTQKHRQTPLGDSSVLSDSEEENVRSENDVVDGSLRSSEYSTSVVVQEEEEALITNPDEYIVFKYPFSEMVTIYVKNKHSRPIMWALKTNAIKRMIAQPTCGTLGKDATVHIKIGVTAVPPEESNMNDRLAIDYCLIDDDTVGFDRSFLYNTEDPFRRRKKFNIYYEN